MTCLPLRYSHNKYVHAAYLKKKKKLCQQRQNTVLQILLNTTTLNL